MSKEKSDKDRIVAGLILGGWLCGVISLWGVDWRLGLLSIAGSLLGVGVLLHRID